MTITAGIRQQVRQRAGCACEFCGVTEDNAASELTIDHYQPQAKGGSDSFDNLIYSCPKCNSYKSDYWPSDDQPALWSPRADPASLHFIEAEDGLLYPLTATGRFTVERLRLNRAPLVIDILPSLKEGDSSSETAMPSRENVPSCIDISVVQRATLGTRPFSYSKSCSTFRTVDRNAAATRTGLGSVRFVDFFKHH